MSVLMADLNDKQDRFCREYLIDLNATQAAIRAGYSEKTARQQASTLLSKPNIQDRIAELKQEVNKELKIDAVYVRQRLVDMDQLDILDILNDDGSVLPVSQWPKVWRISISGFDMAEIWENDGDTKSVVGVLKKIKWPDKVKNLELLGKHIDVGAFRDQVKIEIPKTREEIEAELIALGIDPAAV